MSGTRIEVSDLHISGYANDHRRPLAALDDDENSHIHGRLAIIVDGRELPRLGYFGPDDVCLNTWVRELQQLRSALRADGGRHDFDEGEQGQPVFAFERAGDSVLVSITESFIGGGRADPSWSQVPCPAADFLTAIDRVLDAIQAQVTALGERGERWWRDVSAGH